MTVTVESTDDSHRNQFLTFRIEEEIFGVPIESVREVVDFEPVTRVPGAAEFLRGVLNLRGSVITVADIRLKFGMPPTTQSENTCIIVLELEISAEETSVVAAILADQVLEVAEIRSKDIQNHPELGTGVPSRYLNGLGKINNRFFMILDVAKIICDEKKDT